MRECHKEFKELLVAPDTSRDVIPPKQILQVQDQSAPAGLVINASRDVAGANAGLSEGITVERTKWTKGTAIIGGGCCVHLAVEYMPDPSAEVQGSNGRGVRVNVVDSDNSQLTWVKEFTDGYHVKENIITTKPGATLTLSVLYAIARVRWCEIYSG